MTSGSTADPLEDHREEDLSLPPGPAVLGLGKEALLTRLTTLRSAEQEAAIDYIIQEAKEHNANVFTTTFVLAEVLGTIQAGSHAVAPFWDDLEDSAIEIYHQGRSWDGRSANTPKSQFETIRDLFSEYENIGFKFHEGDLVLNAGVVKSQSAADSLEVYIVAFDGDLWELAVSTGFPVLPTQTPFRSS